MIITLPSSEMSCTFLCPLKYIPPTDWIPTPWLPVIRTCRVRDCISRSCLGSDEKRGLWTDESNRTPCSSNYYDDGKTVKPGEKREKERTKENIIINFVILWCLPSIVKCEPGKKKKSVDCLTNYLKTLELERQLIVLNCKGRLILGRFDEQMIADNLNWLWSHFEIFIIIFHQLIAFLLFATFFDRKYYTIIIQHLNCFSNLWMKMYLSCSHHLSRN